jgi:alcohol dehydrogenase class IV
MSDLSSALGLGRSGDGPSHLATLSELLLTRLPLPRRLGDIPGLERARIPEYAELAMLDHCHKTNPRPCSRIDMENLLDAAW